MDSTVAEARKYQDLCFQIEDKFNVNSDEAKIAAKLSKLSKQFLKEFSAGGFFVINKSVVISVLVHLAGYMVVTVQFNMDDL